MNNYSGFITKLELENRFHKKDFFVYGISVDFEEFWNGCVLQSHIKGFIDTYKYGCKYRGKNVISPQQYVERRENIPIIIMAYRYALEIKKNLETLGLVFSKDFFIYDDDFIFHPDQITKNFIRLNEKRFSSYKVSKDNSKSKILIPFDNKHYPDQFLSVAYAANYYAKETNSLIYAFFRYGGQYTNAINNMKRIYHSLNTIDIVKNTLSVTQKQVVKDLSENIWKSIHTWTDWKKITVKGICFGTTILRDMMRMTVPPFEPDDEKNKPFLESAISNIVFWSDFFNSNDIKLVFLSDGVCWEGYIRDIAISKGIPTYSTDSGVTRMTIDFNYGQPFPYFRRFWDELTEDEKQRGLSWAKKKLDRRIMGTDAMLELENQKDMNVFACARKDRILEDNDKAKILICPHIFEEDSLSAGEFLFDNSYISWLTHLGDLSEMTPNHDWYLKMHPSASKRDFIIMDKLLARYPRIKRLERNVSPKQLKEEGLSAALTIYGTITYEYPLIGINVIACGNYPGVSFDYAYNPKTIEEYDNLILNARNLPPRGNLEGIYQCYAMNYLYYDWDSFHVPINLCDSPEFYMNRQQLHVISRDNGTWKYKVYMDECTDERHEQIMKNIPNILAKADSWRPDVFYKKKAICSQTQPYS